LVQELRRIGNTLKGWLNGVALYAMVYVAVVDVKQEVLLLGLEIRKKQLI